MKYAPIALFVYNRPEHTVRTVEALLKNSLAPESHLFVYSDASKDAGSIKAVDEVREYIRCINGFKSVTLIERKTNMGLAASIIEGVTDLCNEYGKVIVVEDDLVTSPAFLEFMNHSLELYEADKRVWHISGWNYPLVDANSCQAFFWRTMNCWGWATWSDRWCYFRKEPERLVHEWDKEKIKRFNLDGAEEFWEQVVRNIDGRMNTWAIFWHATIFDNGGLCLNPVISYVRNIGHDGTGSHSKETAIYSGPLAQRIVSRYPQKVEVNLQMVELIKQFCKSNQPALIYRVKINVIRSLKNSFRKIFSTKKFCS